MSDVISSVWHNMLFAMFCLQAMYPMSDMIRGKIFDAPPPDRHIFPASPYIQLVSRGSTQSCLPGRMDRLHLELKLPMPGVGVVNVTGPLHAWSFTDQLPTSFQHVSLRHSTSLLFIYGLPSTPLHLLHLLRCMPLTTQYYRR